MATNQNPFRPGPGSKPAYLVGRTEERESIDEALESILADRDENGLVPLTSLPQVIIGPRGVGKTVLLKIAKKRAISADVHVVELNKSLFEGPEESLMNRLVPKSRLKSFLGFLEHFKGTVKFEDLFNVEIGPSGKVVPLDLEATMAAGALVGPMAIFLDEAHTVSQDNLRELCNAAQSLIGDGYPLALFMAGTPEMWSLLMKMGGTFMERSEKMNINLFSADETREALSKGFEGTGFNVDVDSLESLVEWSDRYPYFIQLAGHRTWKIANKRGTKTVTLEVAKAGLELAAVRRKDFYRSRLRELFDSNVLKEALTVTKLFDGRPEGLTWTGLREGLMRADKGMSEEGAKEVERKLMSLGFIFEGADSLEAGIPSLFDYVKANPQDVGDAPEWSIRWPFSKGG